MNPFSFNYESCPFEVHGFFEEVIDLETGKLLGTRTIEKPDRPTGSSGLQYIILTEDLRLVKGYKKAPVTVKASTKSPRQVMTMVQIICGRMKEKAI